MSEFWIAVQDDHGMDLMHRCIEDLDLANIGVIALGGLQTIIHPHSPPIPDRRNSAVNAAFALSLSSSDRGRY